MRSPFTLYIGLLVALFVPNSSQSSSQHAPMQVHPLRTFSADQQHQNSMDDFADLTALGDAIGDKSLVLLDELTHGEGNVFAAKSRIVRFLHQKKGFDVLVLESGLFDVARIWQSDQPVTQQAPGNIFYMYARSQQMQPLWQYIQQSRTQPLPLELAGFDSRLTGQWSKSQLVAQLRLFLSGLSDNTSLNDNTDLPFKVNAVATEAMLAAYLQQIQQLLDGQPVDATPAVQLQFLALNQWLAVRLQGQKQSSAAGFWWRVNASLRQMALVSWQRQRFDQHDLAMAANLRWLLERPFAGRKVIVWGHYIHLNRLGGFQHALVAPATPVGQQLWVPNMASALFASTAEIRNNSYVLHFAGARGSYTDFRDLQQVTLATDQPRLEFLLTQQAGSAVFVPLPQTMDVPVLPMWGHEYKSTLNWSQAQQRFDGLIFLPDVSPAQLLP